MSLFPKKWSIPLRKQCEDMTLREVKNMKLLDI